MHHNKTMATVNNTNNPAGIGEKKRPAPPSVAAAAASAAAASAAAPQPPPAKKTKTTKSSNNTKDPPSLVESTLHRLTQGLPKRELRMMISEANDCEAGLTKDIRVLEQALEGNVDQQALQAILDSPLTPLDTYWTISSLLGRLRDDLALPSILAYQRGTGRISRPPSSISRTATPTNGKKPLSATEAAESLIALNSNPIYTQPHENTVNLLAVWKKISTNRLAVVFKRPVKPEEAPGYADRIVFPMDMSLIRKMIVSRQVQSYRDLHKYIGLICHNCVKYNGRESDYGIVARDFEVMADNQIRAAVLNTAAAAAAAATAAAAVTSVTTAAAAASASAVIAPPAAATAAPATTARPAVKAAAAAAAAKVPPGSEQISTAAVSQQPTSGQLKANVVASTQPKGNTATG